MIDKTIIERQHDIIKKLADQITVYQAPAAVSENAFKLSLLLGELSGRITMHLQHEDRYVYPQLQAHQDHQIQETSNRFMQEMGDLVHEFVQFKTKYLSAARIKKDPEGFIREGKSTLSAITERIAKEDRYLYTLV
jgi:iron-sulfur cluster repair protein YtfE (RIC family)